MQSNGIIFVLSAPSGTGKTTICRMLKKKLPDLQFSISHTTRKPRDQENPGEDYHFITQKDFERKIERNEFLEWAKVFKHYYGTTFNSVDHHRQNGENIIIEIDVQGAKSLKKLNYEAVFIFMLPPSLKELETRLIKRGTESKYIIMDRMETSKNEVAQLTLYDYVLTNFDAEETTNNLISIIKAEQFRKKRYLPTSPDIKTLINGEENN